MSRRVEIQPVVVQGGKIGLLSELAREVVQEMRAEGRVSLAFDPNTLRFASEGEAQVEVDDYTGRRVSGNVEAVRAQRGQDVKDAEARYGLKLQKLRKEQVVANAKKRGYAVKKQVEEGGKVKVVLRRRVYG